MESIGGESTLIVSDNEDWKLLSLSLFNLILCVQVRIRYVMASNAFREFVKDEQEINGNKDREEDQSQPIEVEEEDSEDKMKTKRIRVGTRKRLVEMKECVERLRGRIHRSKTALGTNSYKDKKAPIEKAITSKSDQFLQFRSMDKYMTLIQNSDEGMRQLALELETGWDVAPPIEGKVTMGDLLAARDEKDLEKELEIQAILKESQCGRVCR